MTKLNTNMRITKPKDLRRKTRFQCVFIAIFSLSIAHQVTRSATVIVNPSQLSPDPDLFPSNLNSAHINTAKARWKEPFDIRGNFISKEKLATMKPERTASSMYQGSSAVSTVPPETSRSTQPLDNVDKDTDTHPWRIAAPNIDTSKSTATLTTAAATSASSIPIWMEAYVKFHNDSLHNAFQQTKDTDLNKYLIFTCKKSCSGTGNRQRAIMASFMVAIITNRIFLIDITFPVQLELILQPYRIQWNRFPPHMNDLKSKLLKLRNKNPPVLDSPSKFTSWTGFSVLRVEANSPVNLEQQWRSQEVRDLLAKHGVGRGVGVPGNLYKHIFGTLYRPSPRLVSAVVSLRQQLGIEGSTTAKTTTSALYSPMRYIALHARTGGDGVSWKDADRFTKDNLDNLFGNAMMVRRGMLQSDTNETLPIVVISDDTRAKKILYDKDPSVIRYADTKIIHVDRSGRDVNDLEGSLAVWADILIMAQASCIVKGRGSFSMLGAWLAAKGYGSACMHLVI